jgi:sec-independent protein translocase protein TatC
MDRGAPPATVPQRSTRSLSMKSLLHRSGRANGSKTIVGHLSELRRRLLTSMAVSSVAGVAVFAAFDHVLAFLIHPYCAGVGAHQQCALYITGPLDGLAIRVKVSTYGGLLLASPVVLFELWRFVAPGLRANERRYTSLFVASSGILFIGGSMVAWSVFPHAIRWLGSIGGRSIHELYSPSSYVGLLIVMMFVFGITFELPVLLVSLELAGVVTPMRLASWRRPAIIGMVALAAIITPSSDPFSMLALAFPLIVFYELSIVIGRLALRRRDPSLSRQLITSA